MFRWNGCHKYFNGMFVGHILGHKPKQERELNIKREHAEAETSIRLNSAMLKLRLHYPALSFQLHCHKIISNNINNMTSLDSASNHSTSTSLDGNSNHSASSFTYGGCVLFRK